MILASKAISSRSGFDRFAPFYDALAQLVFGSAIRLSQLATLSLVPPGVRVLIVGGGTGWYLRELLRHRHPQRVVYVDVSAKMIQLARQKIIRTNPQWLPLVEFHTESILTFVPGAKFDVIITHFLLDLFAPEDLRQIMPRLRECLHPDGAWLLADFQLPDDTNGKWWKQRLLRAMYWFFGRYGGISGRCLPDWDSLFADYGLHCRSESTFFRDFITSRMYETDKTKY